MVPRKTEPPERFLQLLKRIVDRDRPYGLEEALRIMTPQALLRDLHRPVGRFDITGFEKIHEGIDRGGIAAMSAIKSTLRTDYRVPITKILDTPRLYREGVAEHRAALAGKWEDAPKLGFGATTSSLMPVMAPSFEEEMASWGLPDNQKK